VNPDRSASFLQMIRRAERGRLKVYLGYAAGVGKTTQMLQEGHRLLREGVDVVVGMVETHGRGQVAELLAGLETLPAKTLTFHGVAVPELDLEGLLKRRPQVALIDELAHSNPPGSRNAKRYQDVQDLRAAGVHVISALNVQHLESLYDTVERVTSVKVRERLPDMVLNDSDEVVNVDLAVTDLLKRVRDGQILPMGNVPLALQNFYRPDNLEQLRELALRELASRIDFRRREEAGDPGWSEQFVVALGPRVETHAGLLRYASRLAGRLNRNWYAVHVQEAGPTAAPHESSGRGRMAETLTLANELGAVVFTVKSDDVVQALLDFARRYRVGNVIVGKPRHMGWYPWYRGARVVKRLLALKGFSVQVVDVNESTPIKGALTEKPSGDGGAPLVADQVLILSKPIGYRDLILSLAILALQDTNLDPVAGTDAVMERESRGSTFLDSGLALPHTSLKGLDYPRMALALPRAGLKDSNPDYPLNAVFLLLTPMNAEAHHLKILSEIGHAFQESALRSALDRARTSEEALGALQSSALFRRSGPVHPPF
jgi:two-component system sensor histidine kinase KdpD